MTQQLLDLRKQQIVELKKERNITTKAQVVVAMDYSGSMSGEYRDGTVQRLTEKLFPLALEFDDDGKLDFYLFDTWVTPKPSVSLNNYQTYVTINCTGSMGWTNYAPVLEQIYKDKFTKWGFLGFGSSTVDVIDVPVYVIFITDGDNSDHSATERLIREYSSKGMFVQFVGIGSAWFPFLQKLDDMQGRVLDNVDFFSVRDIDSMPSGELYSKLLVEFPEWVNAAKSKWIIK